MHLDFKISEISSGFGKWRHRSVTPLSVITSDYFCYYCIKLQISFFSCLLWAKPGLAQEENQEESACQGNAMLWSCHYRNVLYLAGWRLSLNSIS